MYCTRSTSVAIGINPVFLYVLRFDYQVAEATRNASEKTEESSKEESKEKLADKSKDNSVELANKTPYLVTEKFLTDVLGVR